MQRCNWNRIVVWNQIFELLKNFIRDATCALEKGDNFMRSWFCKNESTHIGTFMQKKFLM